MHLHNFKHMVPLKKVMHPEHPTNDLKTKKNFPSRLQTNSFHISKSFQTIENCDIPYHFQNRQTMNKTSMDKNIMIVENLLLESYVHCDNQQGENVIQMAKKSPMHPTPLEFHCCFKHSTTKAVCVYIVFVCLVITTGVLVVCLTAPKPIPPKCQYQLRPTVQYSTRDSSHPQSLAVADFNTDSHMDLVIASSGFDNVTIFLGYGNNTFPNQTSYSMGIGSSPRMVAVGDFNCDNRPDIVVANFGTNNLLLLFGNGNGSFPSRTTVETSPSRPLYVVVGDFNNDGCSDIAFAGYGTNNIGVLLGLCNGTFAPVMYSSTGYDSLPYSIALGDFNHDSQLDIGVANYGTDNVGILVGYGNGTFTNQITYTTGANSHPYSIAIADLNNDTYLDIVVVNSKTDNIKIFLGCENGGFRYSTTYYTRRNPNPIFIAIADFNNDDIPDITVVSNGTDKIMLYFGHGDGTFVDRKEYSTGPRSSPYVIGVGDFNNDNQSDVAIVNEQNNNIKIFNSQTVQTFTSETTFPTSKNSSSIGMSFISTGADSHPNWITIGDFNNDNRLDIVVADLMVSGIVVLLGDGDGRFSPSTSYSIGAGLTPYSIISADFNSDGQLDIALAYVDTSNIAVLLGYGDGEFSPPVIYSTGNSSTPTCIIVGDFNSDGRVDLAVANPGTNNVGVFLGYGNGEFTSQTTYFTGDQSFPTAVTVGDFDNDGCLDIVFADLTMNQVGILLGHGNNEFLLLTTYSTGHESGPVFIVADDFNRDGQLDIAVALYAANSVGVRLGYGNGKFSSQTAYFLGSDYHPLSIVTGDLNDDGCADIAVANFYMGSVGVLFGHGNGKFSPPRIYFIGTDTYPRSIVVGDFNRDDRLDIAVANERTRNVAILLGQDNGNFPYFTYSSKNPRCSTRIAVGDFDNNGRLDIAVANYDMDSVGILLGYGNGSFENQPVLSTGTTSSPISIVVADFNNDNQSDIAVANIDTSNIRIFLGYGDGQFSLRSTYSTGYNSCPISLAVGDFNHDGRLDIVVANFNHNNVGIFIGDGKGKFSPQTTYPTGKNSVPFSVAVADFNNDGQVDIAVLNSLGATVGILLGRSDGTFQSQKTFSIGTVSDPMSLAIGDLNSDGNMDVVVANAQYLEGHVLVLLGDGYGNLSSHGKYLTESKSHLCSVVIGHFNNDTRLDIAVTDNGTSEIAVFLGYGDGTFSGKNSYSTVDNSYPISLAIGDFDDDNLTDLVVANYGSNIIGVFLASIDTNFVDNTTLSTGSAAFPVTIAVGDFTNDGQLDIIVGNDGTHNLDLFINDGNGNFSVQSAYSGDSTFYPTSMVVHDFNNDTRLDLAVANSATDTVTLLYGDGNRTFGNSRMFFTGVGSSPQSVAIGDFNNDNNTDIAVAYSGSGSVGLLLKSDIGALESMKAFSTGSSSKPHGLTVADFDNDGQLDIAVANNGNANIGISFGFGNGSFSEQHTIPLGEDIFPQWVGSGDFNNDKQLDIVVSTNMWVTPVLVLLNNGDRSFRVEKTYVLKAAYRGAVGDFNSDGYLDVVLCQSVDNAIAIIFGYGNGTFRDRTIYSTGASSYPGSIIAGDFNNDSRLDIAVTNLNGYSIGIFLGYGNGTFSEQTIYSSVNQPVSIIIADFNNDGRVDIAVGLFNKDGLGMFFGNGDGTFQPVIVHPTGVNFQSLSINAGDFNNDGRLDIAMIDSGNSNLCIFLQHNNDTFFNQIIYSTGNNSYPFSIGLGDFNNDDRLDVAVSNMLSDNIGVFLGYATEDFLATAVESTGESSQPVSIAVGDLNNDSCLDVVVADRRGNQIVVLQGSGRGTFSSQMNYSTGDDSSPSSVVVNHFNQDQYLDIAVIKSGTNDIGIFLGDKDGTFSSLITSSTGISSLPLSLTVGQFNDDAHLDIAVANFGNNNVCLLFGYGNGSFGSLECHTSGYDSRPFAVASGDMNGDNLTDIVIANKGSSTIEVLTKIC